MKIYCRRWVNENKYSIKDKPVKKQIGISDLYSNKHFQGSKNIKNEKIYYEAKKHELSQKGFGNRIIISLSIKNYTPKKSYINGREQQNSF